MEVGGRKQERLGSRARNNGSKTGREAEAPGDDSEIEGPEAPLKSKRERCRERFREKG